MKRIALNLSLTLSFALSVAHAQNRMAEDAKASYQFVKADLLKAAEKMPESEYAFQPTPDVRTFAQLIAHAADAQMAICGMAKGTPPKRADPAPNPMKADLVAALKASNDFCDAVYNAMTDQAGAEIVKTPFGSKPKLGILTFNTQHDAETYGTIAVYLRMKGIVPPSSETK
jgi:hypothetical protein